jgi:hypothetical protein
MIETGTELLASLGEEEAADSQLRCRPPILRPCSSSAPRPGAATVPSASTGTRIKYDGYSSGLECDGDRVCDLDQPARRATRQATVRRLIEIEQAFADFIHPRDRPRQGPKFASG